MSLSTNRAPKKQCVGCLIFECKLQHPTSPKGNRCEKCIQLDKEPDTLKKLKARGISINNSRLYLVQSDKTTFPKVKQAQQGAVILNDRDERVSIMLWPTQGKMATFWCMIIEQLTVAKQSVIQTAVATRSPLRYVKISATHTRCSLTFFEIHEANRLQELYYCSSARQYVPAFVHLGVNNKKRNVEDKKRKAKRQTANKNSKTQTHSTPTSTNEAKEEIPRLEHVGSRNEAVSLTPPVLAALELPTEPTSVTHPNINLASLATANPSPYGAVETPSYLEHQQRAFADIIPNQNTDNTATIFAADDQIVAHQLVDNGLDLTGGDGDYARFFGMLPDTDIYIFSQLEKESH